MKSELKAKFLQHLISKKRDGGFTLIELLVVIIIIGILAAIALPSFLNQANKAKQSEAKQYVGALVRAQQAYYLENSAFAPNSDELGRVVKPDTTNYSYVIASTTGTAANATINGNSKKDALKNYVGIAQLSKIGGTGSTSNDLSTATGLCESSAPKGTVSVTIGTTSDQIVTCTGGNPIDSK